MKIIATFIILVVMVSLLWAIWKPIRQSGSSAVVTITVPNGTVTSRFGGAGGEGYTYKSNGAAGPPGNSSDVHAQEFPFSPGAAGK